MRTILASGKLELRAAFSRPEGVCLRERLLYKNTNNPDLYTSPSLSKAWPLPHQKGKHHKPQNIETALVIELKCIVCLLTWMVTGKNCFVACLGRYRGLTERQKKCQTYENVALNAIWSKNYLKCMSRNSNNK